MMSMLAAVTTLVGLVAMAVVLVRLEIRIHRAKKDLRHHVEELRKCSDSGELPTLMFRPTEKRKAVQ